MSITETITIFNTNDQHEVKIKLFEKKYDKNNVQLPEKDVITDTQSKKPYYENTSYLCGQLGQGC